MKEKRIVFKNSLGNTLVGYLYKNSGSSLIISCHGTHPYGKFPQALEYFAFYQKLGFSTFRFDFSGYGESEGQVRLLQRIDDLDAAVAAVGANYKEIILSAISLGGLPAAIAATQNKKITRLIITNGVFNFTQINFLLRLWVFIFLLFHPHQRNDKKVLATILHPEKITVPTLIIYCEKDTIVSPKQSKEFFAKLKAQKTIQSIPDANHYDVLKERVMEKANTIVRQWFLSQHLPK